VIKLIRVLMPGPMLLGFSLLAGSVKPAHTGLDRRRTELNEFLPWFIVGF
jgi:uncharacterized membrane protein YadS